VIVMYDSLVGKPFIRGEHHGNPRMWQVKVRVSSLPDSLTFTPNGKVYISDLSDIVDAQIVADLASAREDGTLIDTGKPMRIRWTATAR
jgi:hypothetical protein